MSITPRGVDLSVWQKKYTAADFTLAARSGLWGIINKCSQGYLPKHTKWCVGKYGPCEYKQVCGLEPQYRELSLYSNEYRDVTWDPLTD